MSLKLIEVRAIDSKTITARITEEERAPDQVIFTPEFQAKKKKLKRKPIAIHYAAQVAVINPEPPKKCCVIL